MNQGDRFNRCPGAENYWFSATVYYQVGPLTQALISSSKALVAAPKDTYKDASFAESNFSIVEIYCYNILLLYIVLFTLFDTFFLG